MSHYRTHGKFKDSYQQSWRKVQLPHRTDFRCERSCSAASRAILQTPNLESQGQLHFMENPARTFILRTYCSVMITVLDRLANMVSPPKE